MGFEDQFCILRLVFIGTDSIDVRFKKYHQDLNKKKIIRSLPT